MVQRARRARRQKPRAASRGAAVVEFALVAPLLILLLFGIVEFGFVFNDYQSVRQGVRDATRVAVVNNVPNCSTGDATDDLICYVEQRIGLSGDTRVRVDVTAANPAVGGDRGSVKVCVQRQIRSVTGMLSPFLNGRYISTEVTMRVERGNEPAFVDRSEAAANGSWASC
jgi:Flp pilus assembly protein TadG